MSLKMKSEMKVHRLMSTLFGLAGLCAVLGFAATATALSAEPSLVIASEPILMSDGSGDGYVDIMVFDTETDFNFGYYDGAFHQILSASGFMATQTFADGDIVDFAIQSAADSSTIFKLSDGIATLVFAGPTDDYWENVTITWAVGNNNLVMAMSSGDGFAPSYTTTSVAAIPEPTAALTFAVGLAVAGWRVRRQPRA